MTWQRAAAIAAYAVLWLAILFGYLHVNDSGAGYQLLRALAVVLPALALGLYVSRWWVVLAGLVFLFASVLPERTTIDGAGVDVTETGVYGVTLTQALELIAVTTPWLLLGVLLRRRAAAVEARGATP
jgi:hypothetical protein